MTFQKEYKQYLLKKSKIIAKKLNIEDNSTKRFVSFFHLHRTDGLPTTYQDV